MILILILILHILNIRTLNMRILNLYVRFIFFFHLCIYSNIIIVAINYYLHTQKYS